MVAIHTSHPNVNSVKYFKALRKAQFSQEQAEGLALGFEHLIENLATKADVRDSELRLLKEIESIRQETVIIRQDLTREIEMSRKELSIEITASRTELNTKIEKNREDLTREIEKNREDLTREIEKNREDLTREIEKNREDLTREIEMSRQVFSAEIETSRKEHTVKVEELRKDSNFELALIRKDIAIFTENTQKRLVELKMELAIWMFSIGVSSVLAIVGLLKYTH